MYLQIRKCDYDKKFASSHVYKGTFDLYAPNVGSSFSDRDILRIKFLLETAFCIFVTNSEQNLYDKIQRSLVLCHIFAKRSFHFFHCDLFSENFCKISVLYKSYNIISIEIQICCIFAGQF